MKSAQKTAVIAGASGFIGKRLVREFQNRGYSVLTIGRGVGGSERPDARWDDSEQLRLAVDGADVVVNLAGKSVNCRYNDSNRRAILTSRTDTTAALRRAIAASERPPRLWINASTATIYRNAMDRPQSEADGEHGAGFSVDVAKSWEDELFAEELPGTRRVALRISIVLGRGGPAARLLLLIAKLGLGGPQFDGWWFPHRRYRGIGSNPTGPDDAVGNRSRGRQKFSWVHIDDLVRAVFFIDEHEELEGPINLAAPSVVDNRTLMKTLRYVAGTPFGFPAYRWMLEPAMMVVRSEPEMLLKSRWIDSAKLRDAGFTFSWQELEPALRDIADRERD